MKAGIVWHRWLAPYMHVVTAVYHKSIFIHSVYVLGGVHSVLQWHVHVINKTYDYVLPASVPKDSVLTFPQENLLWTQFQMEPERKRKNKWQNHHMNTLSTNDMPTYVFMTKIHDALHYSGILPVMWWRRLLTYEIVLHVDGLRVGTDTFIHHCRILVHERFWVINRRGYSDKTEYVEV